VTIRLEGLEKDTMRSYITAADGGVNGVVFYSAKAVQRTDIRMRK
jgi:hypothetical protein